MEGHIWQKNNKVYWLKISNKVMFSWKESGKTTKNSVAVSVHRKGFYSCEDIVCTCDSLADPCSIKTFDNGIILVFEMILYLKNLPTMKRIQITQFEGYFDIARCNSVWQLFPNSISIPCVERFLDKLFCWLIDANIERLELAREIVWNNNQLIVILCT